MQLKDVMTRHVATARPDNTIAEAAEKMRSLDIGPLPVTEGAKVVGVLTDRDITTRAVAEGRDPRSTRVGDIMTRDVFFCFEDQDVKEAATLMSDLQVRRLLILDRESNLAGIVSLGDLALEAGDDKMTAKVLNRVSQPAHGTLPERARDHR
jgi:CBS domain-containing protein